jgi:hypothetical protein
MDLELENENNDDEVTEDELNQAVEWDSRNFGDQEFLPDGRKYKVGVG